MEKKKNESRICRLCGHYGNIYMDVFSDEGTRRFLSFKIHSKINILIDERDPLPKAICVQCLGKLEFVCDFQEECLRTQQLLRDQYNLPSLTDIEENKPEDSAPSTSATSSENNVINNKENTAENSINNVHAINSNINNNNNNNSNKNYNPPDNEMSKDDSRAARSTTKLQRNLRSQQNHLKLILKKDSQQSQILNDNEDILSNVQQTEVSTTTTRKLRSRQSIEEQVPGNEVSETDTNSKVLKSASVTKKRLRRHNISIDTTTNSKVTLNQNVGKKNQADSNNKIQIPTNTLNKVLSAITNAPGIGVSVKEPTSRNSDAEDISFTVELCKKQETDSLTVVAKVFPEQGSCLVDKSIVTFLEEGTNEEVNNLVNNIVSPNTPKDNSCSLIDKLQNAEDIANSSRNPEELFKMDGEEIHVDENVEQITVNDNQVSYACKLCRKIYERKDKCTVHVKTHLGIKQYMCILCQAKFVCKSDVMKHIRCSHTNPRPISCPKCPKRFRSKFDLAEHNNVHKGVKPYQCADCDQSYHHKVSLQMHVKSHMPPQNLACEYCGKVFPYRTRLLSHIGSVHMKDKRNFRCRFCYNLYSSLSVLNEHIKTRHTTTYTCETCGKTFKVASKYKAHVLQHSNPKPFVCEICKNRYASKAFLNEHVLKHQGVRKHVCQKCGASFGQASHLAAHRHVHGEKSHACPECGKMFNRRDNMKVHRRRHLLPDGKKSIIKQKNFSNNENKVISNEKIKPDDGLPQVICVQCLGIIEFWCDFHSICHDFQETLKSTNEKIVNDKEEPKKKLESDAESDKENVLPVKNGKRKGKVLHSEEAKLTKTVASDESRNIDESDISIELSTENSSDSTISTAVNLSVINTNLDSVQENLNVLPCDKTVEKELNLEESTVKDIESVINKKESRETNRLSRFTKSEKHSKTSSSIKIKSKKTNVKSINKTIDKYFNSPSQYKGKNNDEENLNPNHTKEIFSSNTNDNEVQENVIFEGTVINSADDSSIVMPLKTEISNHHIKLDNVVMADGSEIVQADEIVWISSNTQLPEPEKPITMKNQSKIASPAPGDEAETVEKDGTVLVQTSGHDINSASSTEQLIVLEVQLPVKDKYVTLPKNMALLKRNRSLSLASSRRSSEGKYARISELMTEEQKNEIETHYKIEMALVDDSKVAENVIILDKSKYQCKICRVTYPRLDKCQVHIWRHLDMKPFLCKTCDFSTLTVSNIRCHIRKSHLKIKPFGCHLCNKSYNSATLLEEHLNIHTGTRPFQCDFCDFASTSKQILAHHILIHKEVKDVNCDICGKAFYSKGRMRAHKITHNKDQAFKCTLCSTYLSHKEALEKHYENVHKKDYICKICNKVYKSRKALHNHESVHSDAKFKCPMCPNVYKSTHILKEHILKHQGIRQYKCNNCDKSFAQQSHLAAHMAVHSNITYKCPGCQKGFNRHDNMKVHTKRCEKFLADPSLQKLLTKRKISFSKNNTAKVNIQKENEKSIYQKEKHDSINASAEKDTEGSELGNKPIESQKIITTEEF